MATEIRKVEFGIENAYYAPVLPEGAGFDAPIPLIGATGCTMEIEATDTPIHADNRVHLTIPGTDVVTGELSMLQLPESFMIHAHGRKKMVNGMLTNTGDRKVFALMFQGVQLMEDGTTTKVIHTFYNCLSGKPGFEKTTKADEVEAEALISPMTYSPSSYALDDEGIPTTYTTLYYSPETALFFSNFGKEIILPMTPGPVEFLTITPASSTVESGKSILINVTDSSRPIIPFWEIISGGTGTTSITSITDTTAELTVDSAQLPGDSIIIRASFPDDPTIYDEITISVVAPVLATLTITGPLSIPANGNGLFEIINQSRPGEFIWTIMSGEEGTTRIEAQDPTTEANLIVDPLQTEGSMITIRATYADDPLSFTEIITTITARELATLTRTAPYRRR